MPRLISTAWRLLHLICFKHNCGPAVALSPVITGGFDPVVRIHVVESRLLSSLCSVSVLVSALGDQYEGFMSVSSLTNDSILGYYSV